LFDCVFEFTKYRRTLVWLKYDFNLSEMRIDSRVGESAEPADHC